MIRFHKKHGHNVMLIDDNFVAKRTRSFANAVVFSNLPLLPEKHFLIEIEDQEVGWSGHLRCGLTVQNPGNISVPQYLLPDLVTMGGSWVFAIKSEEHKPFGDDPLFNIDDGPMCIDLPAIFNGRTKGLLPTSKGSRIAMRYDLKGNMYFIVNGKQYGPCATDVPFNEDVYAVVDVYGTTKQVRIIPCEVPRLQELCQALVSKAVKNENIESLPLPLTLKRAIKRTKEVWL